MNARKIVQAIGAVLLLSAGVAVARQAYATNDCYNMQYACPQGYYYTGWGFTGMQPWGQTIYLSTPQFYSNFGNGSAYIAGTGTDQQTEYVEAYAGSGWNTAHTLYACVYNAAYDSGYNFLGDVNSGNSIDSNGNGSSGLAAVNSGARHQEGMAAVCHF